MDSLFIAARGKLADNVLRTLGEKNVVLSSDLALICLEDFEKTLEALKSCGRKHVMCFSPVVMAQSVKLKELADGLGIKLCLGAVLTHYQDLGTDDALLAYSGSKEVYELFEPLVSALGENKYYGENIVEAPMMSYTAIGTHYGYVLSFYAGLGMCRKYGFPLNTYMYETLKSLPPISEGAYRNVWGDFDSPSDFSEFDDVIHCGEMLVRDMKRNGSIEELHHNRDRQILIQHTLDKHWNDLMGDFEKLSGKDGE